MYVYICLHIHICQGDWVDDLREGYGIMKYLSGGSYEGEWRADKKSGLGVMVWRATDEIYSGNHDVYIHTYIHAYMHMYIHTCIHAYVHTY